MSNVVIQGFPNNGAYTLADLVPPAGYNKYVALLTQSGTNAPVATVLENTLGVDITWVRIGTGVYQGQIPDPLFLVNKTWAICGQTGLMADSHTQINYNLDTNLVVATFSYPGGSLSDDILNYTSIEIRIYP